MNFPFAIARRFMLGGKGAGPSRLTGWIAIIGLTVGCMAMILSVSILNGFESRVINRIIGFEGDIRVSALTDWANDVNTIQSIDGVKTVMPFQERKGLILGRDDAQRMVLLKAVNPELITSFYELNMITAKETDLPQVFLGEMTARRLNLSIGDGLRIMSPIDQGSAWGLPRQIQCVVGGVFSVQVLDLDDKIAFIPAEFGRKLFIRKNGPDGLDIRLNENDNAEKVAESIRQQFPNAKVETWGDLHRELFGAMKFERIGALAVLSLIILVACFNLVTTLVLVTAQKVREFGILQVMGTTQESVRSIVMHQGGMIGGMGIVAGIGIGLLMIMVQNVFGIVTLPEDIYFTPTLPMIILTKDVITILSISVGMVILSAFIAARRALMISPIEAVYLEK
ncbi:MAG: FtsX-like permease family protein [Candidatus Marinimicrobia bacterium]|jgi:lipoprotein-releasing system permease protein|nr:FtsX-like permease family protein [Candidatus Neomarinimicrobiota bacterium]MBT3676202.1 FtsX-like permease family protein [Candidatus Neomarinimicrobiota bacterium]MBT3762760.1 FtsX-like permease family protein [Candidatus Neomarinimicrobiota bacterium]MBT4067378.1 FtsX-like permease family protein [Candidatus Neomarinimicrobiota bacterium]MBT4270888.1 FtsX-like permease family protein [Candidatus Neomarinimicrobiota bacterium]